MNYWIVNSQNRTELQPCHREDCCVLSESSEPKKIVEVKEETKEMDPIKGNINLQQKPNC